MQCHLEVLGLEDNGDLALDAQQIMAGSSGNLLLMERAEVDVIVQKLFRRARGQDKAHAASRFDRTSAEKHIAQLDRCLLNVEAGITRRVATRGDQFRATVERRVFETGRKRRRRSLKTFERSRSLMAVCSTVTGTELRLVASQSPWTFTTECLNSAGFC